MYIITVVDFINEHSTIVTATLGANFFNVKRDMYVHIAGPQEEAAWMY